MKLSKSDVLVLIGTLTGIVLLLTLFFADIRLEAGQRLTDPVGTIVFRRRIAVRRSISGLSWEAIRNHSTVYNKDIIRTGDKAEAVLLFDDQGSLDILENTMLQLNLRQKEPNLDLFEGSIILNTSEDEEAPSINISAGGSRVTLSRNSIAALSIDSQSIGLDIGQGEVHIESESGETYTLQQGQILEIDRLTNTSTLTTPPVSARFPLQNSRLLLVNTIKDSISFKLQGELEGSILQIAPEHSFQSPTQQIEVPVDGQLAIELEEGIHFWRVINSTAEILSPTRRLILEHSTMPRPLRPAAHQAVEYNTEIPALRFTWSPAPAIQSYRLELSRDNSFSNPELIMRSTSNGLHIAPPADGSWYWRVVPIFGIPTSSPLPEPGHQFFVLNQARQMHPPQAISPGNGSTIKHETLQLSGIDFSWSHIPQAVKYQLTLRNTPEGPPVMTKETTTAFYRLSSEEARGLKEAKTWYWQVSWIDTQGKISPKSSPADFSVQETAIDIRLAFPPDGYRITEGLATQTRFTWKTALQEAVILQFSADPSFSELIRETPVQGDTAFGTDFPPGEYYWRVIARHQNQQLLYETDPRSFFILEPYPGPVLLYPDPETPFALRPGESLDFAWEENILADYYSLRLRNLDTGAVLFSVNTDDPGQRIALSQYPEGRYSVDLQAMSFASPNATRMTGYIRRNPMHFRVLSLIDYRAPADNFQIPGLQARQNPLLFSWHSRQAPENTRLVIFRSDNTSSPVHDISTRQQSARVSGLGPGTYLWTVQGAIDGFDISPRQMRRFTVLPIPPFSGPGLIAPSDRHVFGATELAGMRTMDFSWNRIDGATHYRFILSTGQTTLVSRILTANRFSLEDLSILQRGEYTWSVEAMEQNQRGSILRHGTPSRGQFEIDLPQLRRPVLPEDSEIYGR